MVPALLSFLSFLSFFFHHLLLCIVLVPTIAAAGSFLQPHPCETAIVKQVTDMYISPCCCHRFGTGDALQAGEDGAAWVCVNVSKVSYPFLITRCKIYI